MSQCTVLAKDKGLWVSVVEFGNELFGALDIMDRAPFVFFDTITLPVY